MSNSIDILSAVRRTDQALAEQVARWESLEFGVAYCSKAFASLAAANQLRDVWLAEIDGETAFGRAEAYFAERNLTCRAWAPAAAQEVEPLEAVLVPKGWQRVDALAMHLTDWSACDAQIEPAIRVLPARAMPKGYRRSFAEAGASDDETNAAFERLNDANYDAFVAMSGDQPVGRAAYLEVGDIARLADLFVAPPHRRHGIACGLIRHVLQLARRLAPRALVASVPACDTAGADFLRRAGFSPAGMQTQFVRPP